MSTVFAAVQQNAKVLENIGRWLDKAEAHATLRNFDVAVLLGSRLAADQHPLLRQIQSACDNAKFAAARIAGKEPPRHPDTETTVAELRVRLADVAAYVRSFTAADFAGAEERKITLAVLGNNTLTGLEYLVGFVTPNFYFHVTTAYSILRHNGVDLGKMDFIGSLQLER